MKMYLIGLLLAAGTVFAEDATLSIAGLKSKIADGQGSVRDLQKLGGEYRKSGDTADGIIYFTSIGLSNNNADMKACALCLAIPLLVKAGNIEAAIVKGEYVIDNFEKTKWAEECLYTLGEIYRDISDDSVTAAKYFDQLRKDFPDTKMHCK